MLCKGSIATPIEELGRLTQFAGSYASTTIEKAMEIQQLLKQEEIIFMLEQRIETEKKKITKHWQVQVIELQHRFNSLIV